MNDWTLREVSATPAQDISTIHRGPRGTAVDMAAALNLTFSKTLSTKFTDPLQLIYTGGSLGLVGVANQQWNIAFFSAPVEEVEALHVNYFRKMNKVQLRWTGAQGGAGYPIPSPAPVFKYLGAAGTGKENLWRLATQESLCEWRLKRVTFPSIGYFLVPVEVTTSRKWDELIPLDEQSREHWFALDVDWDHATAGAATQPDPILHQANQSFGFGISTNWNVTFQADRGQEP
jgi:hypothetical protein